MFELLLSPFAVAIGIQCVYCKNPAPETEEEGADGFRSASPFIALNLIKLFHQQRVVGVRRWLLIA